MIEMQDNFTIFATNLNVMENRISIQSVTKALIRREKESQWMRKKAFWALAWD